MSEPWEQSTSLDEDDFVEGIDDEEDELSAQPEPPQRPRVLARPQARPAPAPRAAMGQGAGQGPRKYRVRAMSPRMAARSKDVASILITKTDGSQVLLVRKG